MASLAPWILPLALALLALLALGLTALLLRRGRQAPELAALPGRLESLERAQERSERALREDVARGRSEVEHSLRSFDESIQKAITRFAELQNDHLNGFALRIDRLTGSNEERLEKLRGTIDEKLAALQSDNAQKLEQMRATVEEKLQGALEKRLGESFKQVSERLEQVHSGLGEMKNLAAGVGDLKKVLANVKQRGGWGEVQLANLLEQVLAPNQYEANVATRPRSGERVEFAIKLPGRDEGEAPVWLPIDSKFPLEDYQRLVEATERGDTEAAEAAGKALEMRLRVCAREVQGKYLDPPHTTDFALLFLPTEGLYAEALRRPGLADALQREHRVVLTGPTTLWAVLNSLQMGFRTLAIEKRSGEVWSLLAAVKTEFGRFGESLEAVQKKLEDATRRMDDVTKRTRVIDRRLRDVQELPAPDARQLLPGLDDPSAGDE